MNVRIDLVTITRFEKHERIAKKILSSSEYQEYLNASDKMQYVASRFCLKEAFFKSIKKGILEAINLNKVLQQFLNSEDSRKREKRSGDNVFREGDKVMQTKNNYELEWEIVSKYGIPIDKGLGIFNGDMGRILQINEYAGTIVVEYDEHRRVTYPFIQVEELELAYAITIHKAQGSEYAAVVMPLLSGPRMLFNRNLLYTGVTRAKSCVTI